MMSDGVNEMMVALSAVIPAAVLVGIVSARKIAEALPQELLVPVSKLRLSPLGFGWTAHLATAFLICSCILGGLSMGASGPSMWLGALAGFVASVLAFVLMPPLAETKRAGQPVERAKAWGISIPVLVIGGALLSIAYFVVPSTDAQSKFAALESHSDSVQDTGPNGGV